MSKYLEARNFPQDLKDMDYDELKLLSYELRDFLVESVSKTGGHLASNLGIVEIAIALHKCLDTPEDKIVWDVGHQSYVHKILTGRLNQFDTLRKHHGLSGFPKMAESEFDTFDTGHSSNSISLGLGLAMARDLKNEDYTVVSVIGDGAITGGLAYEALNNAGHKNTNLIVILNDNGMSISPNTGGISRSLGRITSTDKYIHMKTQSKIGLSKVPVIGDSMISGIHSAKAKIKYAVIDGIFFEELGFKYIGPIDGHDIKELCETIERVKDIQGPILIHTVTKKGKGYSKAEENPGRFHGIGAFDIKTGEPLTKSSGKSYSKVFGNKLVDMAREHEDVVAISAAMIDGVSLEGFKRAFPRRLYDVGIAEAHAVSFSAGLAKAGLRPYVAIYSSFFQRAYDQIIEDVCLQNLPVTFCIDRAGVVGSDGETHHGIFDLAYLKSIPNLTVFAPKDGYELEVMLEASYNLDGPCAIRYPRGEALYIEENPNVRIGKAQVYKPGLDCIIISVGTMFNTAIEASKILQDNENLDVGIINLSSIKPLDREEIIKTAKSTKLIVTLEDGVVCGGIGESIASLVNSNGEAKTLTLGWPDKFIEHGTQSELYAEYGLDAKGVASSISKHLKG